MERKAFGGSGESQVSMSSSLTESVTKGARIGLNTSDLLRQAKLSTFEPLVEKLLLLLFILPQAEENEAYSFT